MNINDIAQELHQIYKYMGVMADIEENTIILDYILPIIKKENFETANELFIDRKNYSVSPLYGDEDELEANRMDIIIKNEDADVEKIKKDIDEIINKLRSF